MKNQMQEVQKTSQLADTSRFVSTILLALRYLLWGLLILIGLMIVSINADSVVLNYFWSTASLPLSLLLLCTFTIGWLIGIAMSVVSYIKLNFHNRRLEQRCFLAEEEIMRLKKDFSPDNESGFSV